MLCGSNICIYWSRPTVETTVTQHVWWKLCYCRRRKKSIPLVLIPEANYQLTIQAHSVFRPDLVIMHLCCAIDYNMRWVFSASISVDHSKMCVLISCESLKIMSEHHACFWMWHAPPHPPPLTPHPSPSPQPVQPLETSVFSSFFFFVLQWNYCLVLMGWPLVASSALLCMV